MHDFVMKTGLAASFAIALLLPGCGVPLARAEGKLRECLAPAETREAIAERGLVRPIVALRTAAVQFGAEALSAKLCRWGADYVYEIALLQKDGRVVHAFVNAASGDIQGSRTTR